MVSWCHIMFFESYSVFIISLCISLAMIGHSIDAALWDLCCALSLGFFESLHLAQHFASLLDLLLQSLDRWFPEQRKQVGSPTLVGQFVEV